MLEEAAPAPCKRRRVFDPAVRLSPDRIAAQAVQVAAAPMVDPLLRAVPDPVVVLGPQRQIVFANPAFLQLADVPEVQQILGRRPGEALHCAHASESRNGCGGSRFCEGCEAGRALLHAQEGEADVQTCCIVRDNGEALDLEVHATPFRIGGRAYTVFCIIDRSDEKRRRALERIFFHDVLNTAGGLSGFADLLRGVADKTGDAPLYADAISRLSRAIVEEIQAQRDLLAAESHELRLHVSPLDALDLLDQVARNHRPFGLSRQRDIEVAADSQSVLLNTDPVLLRRVLSNMTKNAIEATSRSDLVTLRCSPLDGGALLEVHNSGTIPKDVQLQIFKRSFSTKGEGRGLGTYSIKLLTESYLRGRVSFTSNQEKGTTFRAWVPSLDEEARSPFLE